MPLPRLCSMIPPEHSFKFRHSTGLMQADTDSTRKWRRNDAVPTQLRCGITPKWCWIDAKLTPNQCWTDAKLMLNWCWIDAESKPSAQRHHSPPLLSTHPLRYVTLNKHFASRIQSHTRDLWTVYCTCYILCMIEPMSPWVRAITPHTCLENCVF